MFVNVSFKVSVVFRPSSILTKLGIAFICFIEGLAVLSFGVDELVAVIALYTLPELSDYRPLHPFLFKN